MVADIFVLEVVGFCVVAKQIPLAVTVAPPLLVMLPPPVAVVDVKTEIAVVVIVGRAAKVLTVTCAPYSVPTLFVAYALI
jgi:hypothetical protein